MTMKKINTQKTLLATLFSVSVAMPAAAQKVLEEVVVTAERQSILVVARAQSGCEPCLHLADGFF